MSVAWVLIIFACQLGPAAPMTRAACTWSAVARPYQSFDACQAEGARRMAIFSETLKPANFVWLMCLPRDDMIAGDPT
jgi:hypothetical protein